MNSINKYIHENVYEFLEIPNFSDLYTIKKSFRKLSLKYHPDKYNVSSKDKNTYKELFQKLKDIYSYLLENKEYYDSLLKKNIEKNSNMDTTKKPILKQYNNQMNTYTQDTIYEYMEHIKDIEVNVEITFSEAFTGVIKPVQIQRTCYVLSMKGTNNVGETSTLKHSEENEVIYVECFKGIDNGETIIVENKGNSIHFNNTIHKSHVKVKIILLKHSLFKRNGLDLIYTKHLSLVEALTDFSFSLHHINGKEYIISNENRIIQLNDTKVIRHLGFQRNTYTGNLIIEFNIVFPKTLNPTQKQDIKNIL